VEPISSTRFHLRSGSAPGRILRIPIYPITEWHSLFPPSYSCITILFLDGVYAEDKYGVMRFHRVKAPTIEELNTLVHQISHRVTRLLEKKGLLQRDNENPYL